MECGVVFRVLDEAGESEGSQEAARAGESFEEEVDGQGAVASFEWKATNDFDEVPAGAEVGGLRGQAEESSAVLGDLGGKLALNLVERVGGADGDEWAWVFEGVDEFGDELRGECGRLCRGVEDLVDDGGSGAEAAWWAVGESSAEKTLEIKG